MEFKVLNSNLRLFLKENLNKDINNILKIEGGVKYPTAIYKIDSADIKGGRGFDIYLNGMEFFIDEEARLLIEFDKWGVCLRIYHKNEYGQLLCISMPYEEVRAFEFKLWDGDYYENYGYYEA